MRKRCVLGHVGFASVLAALGGTAVGAIVLPEEGATLDEILNGSYGGSFEVLDKRFDFTNFDGTSGLAHDILVKPVVFPNPLDGIGFDLIFSNVTISDDDKEVGNDDG